MKILSLPVLRKTQKKQKQRERKKEIIEKVLIERRTVKIDIFVYTPKHIHI